MIQTIMEMEMEITEMEIMEMEEMEMAGQVEIMMMKLIFI